ncbi:unnamed protein product, partial [marine sediment metagenome]
LAKFRSSIKYTPKNLDVILDLSLNKEKVVVLNKEKDKYWFYSLKEGINYSGASCEISDKKEWYVKVDKNINYALKKIEHGYVYDRIKEYLDGDKEEKSCICCKCCKNFCKK